MFWLACLENDPQPLSYDQIRITRPMSAIWELPFAALLARLWSRRISTRSALSSTHRPTIRCRWCASSFQGLRLFARHQSHRARLRRFCVSEGLAVRRSNSAAGAGHGSDAAAAGDRGAAADGGAVIAATFAQPAAWRSKATTTLVLVDGLFPIFAWRSGMLRVLHQGCASAGFRVFGLSSIAIRARKEMAALGMEVRRGLSDVPPARGRFSRRRSDPATRSPSRRIASCPSPWFTCGRRSMILCSGGYCPPRWLSRGSPDIVAHLVWRSHTARAARSAGQPWSGRIPARRRR